MRAICCSILVLALTLTPGCGEKKEGAGTETAAAAEGGDDKAGDDKADDKAGDDKAGDDKAGDKAAADKPAAAGDDADLTERCGKAFDNLMSIMVKEGAPAPIVEQMKGQRDKTIGECIKETKAQPDGNKALECMTSAQSQADIVACTQKHAKSGPGVGAKKPAPAPAAGDKPAAPAGDKPAPEKKAPENKADDK